MSIRIEAKGVCHFVGETQTIGSKGFKKKTFVIKEEGLSEYPSYLSFSLKQDKCSLVTEKNKGDILSVVGYVEAREWIDPNTNIPKYFTDITAVKVSVESTPSVEESTSDDVDDVDTSDMIEDCQF